MASTIAYLDYNATAPIRPNVAAAMAEALAIGGNPSSVHRPGRAARQAIERARVNVAALVGASADHVIFTSGGTEANNLALGGLPAAALIVSSIEHDSVLAPVRARGQHAFIVRVLPDGIIDLDDLARALAEAPRPALVSVMLANNETGAIQPIVEVSRLARDAGAWTHCDAVQAAGKIAVDRAGLGVDLLSLSAHKLGGPQGVGALIARPELGLAPNLLGGRQELGRRAGTENVAGIVGFGVAASAAAAGIDRAGAIGALRDDIERRLKDIAPDLAIHAANVPRLPNTTCLGVAGLGAETQVIALDLAGVAVSAGAACSSGKVRPSHVLLAMGCDAAAAACAIRISLGWASAAADVDRLIAAWGALYARARAA